MNRQQERKPPHGEHPQRRLLGSVRAVQGGPVGGAERVPGGTKDVDREGATDAAQGQPA